MSFSGHISDIHAWLKNDVIPLWLHHGFDEKQGCFVESFSRLAVPENSPRRAIVQMRQVYSVCELVRLGHLEKTQATQLVDRTINHLFRNYLQSRGVFIHSVDFKGEAVNRQEDLYTQAFVLFGLAHAFDLTKNVNYKNQALNLLDFLYQNRKHEYGGFTEIIQGQTLFQSNPHMHLFEAALAWLAFDSDPAWENLALHLFDLCQTKFIDPKTQLLAEHFDAHWTPVLHEGRFVFEPGHQFEWAWLLLQFQSRLKISTQNTSYLLFTNGQKFGVNQVTGYVYDEVWSDFLPKKTTSRLWPHCEWMKAAVEVGQSMTDSLERQNCAQIADQGLKTLFKYFKDLPPGLWEDLHLEQDSFSPQPVKASSLYHIINALSEYLQKRPQLIS